MAALSAPPVSPPAPAGPPAKPPAIEALLRAVPTAEKVFRSARRVRVFKAADAVTLLSGHGVSAEDIRAEIGRLLREYRLVRVRLGEKSASSVDIAPGRRVGLADLYMWAETEDSRGTVLVGVLVVALFMMLVMFQLWPAWLKRSACYVKYPILGFLAFLLVMAVVRLVVFAVTVFAYPPGLWVLPNLFADCGFFESFVPVYAWADENVEHKRGSCPIE